MAGGSSGSDSGSDVFIWMAAIIGAMFAVTLLYGHFRGPINYALMWVSYIALLPATWVSHYAAEVHAAMLRYRPSGLTFHEVMLFFGYAMGWWRIVTIPLFAILAVGVWKTGLDGYSRRFTARSLLEQQAKVVPVIAPALQRNFLEEPQHTGPWRMEETPIEWVLRRKILVYRDNSGKNLPVRPDWIFDKNWVLLPPERTNKDWVSDRVFLHQDRLKVYLRAQLGPAAPERFDPALLSGPRSPGDPHHRKALATAFALFALRDREDAYDLLNTFSASFRDHGDRNADRIDYEIDTSDVDEALEQVRAHAEYADLVHWVGRHGSYTNPMMAALLEVAREYGELAPVRFLWLRAVDRALWCTLHQAGGRTAWTEALAPWAHLDVERELGISTHQLGYSFTLASDSLEDALAFEGWLPPKNHGGEFGGS